jgi:hypothetical protein
MNESMFSRSLTISLALLGLVLFTGCSSKLSRGHAQRDIDAMLKMGPTGPKGSFPENIPGFNLASNDTEPVSSYIHVGDHVGYFDSKPVGEDYLREALVKMGYLTVTEGGGPVSEKIILGGKIDHPHSRSVHFTDKAGTSIIDKTKQYSSGFDCYPPPEYGQCNIPSLIDVDWQHYAITGIVQDEIHAKVNILIPVRLTPFALELKPFAKSLQDEQCG